MFLPPPQTVSAANSKGKMPIPMPTERNPAIIHHPRGHCRKTPYQGSPETSRRTHCGQSGAADQGVAKACGRQPVVGKKQPS